MTLATELAVRKNTLEDDGGWLLLLEVTIPQLPGEVLRFARNNENVTWNGDLYQRFSFEVDNLTWTSEGKLPEISIRVANPAGVVEQKVAEAEGGYGSTVSLHVVHSEHLASASAMTLSFELINCIIDDDWVTFKLGTERPFMRRYPIHTMALNTCRWKVFKGPECRYVGAETTCNRTLARCIELGMEFRFGAFPGMPGNGIAAL
jgi:phage-related protein